MITTVFLISNDKDDFVQSVVPLRPLAFQDRKDAEQYVDTLLHRDAKKMRIREYRLVEEKVF